MVEQGVQSEEAEFRITERISFMSEKKEAMQNLQKQSGKENYKEVKEQ